VNAADATADIPARVTEMNHQIAVEKQAGQVYYFYGHMPVFHHQEDVRGFRMFTSQMIVNGTVKLEEIVEAFGVPMKVFLGTGRLLCCKSAPPFRIRVEGGSPRPHATFVRRGTRSDDARPLLRQIFDTEVDLMPGLAANILTVRLHHLRRQFTIRPSSVGTQINATRTIFPGIRLTLVFQNRLILSSPIRSSADKTCSLCHNRAGGRDSLS
jgi:hypothetical protein